jgi:coenzyme F420-dependent glucose-6-phosphate dehydrogenase
MIGFHCSHEQHAPSALLALSRRAEEAGFRAAMCSDHFHPWSERQAHSGFSWAWLGAALEATRASFGTVCAPGQRYHPAVIAQAAATLAEMYVDRFWVAFGSGEALNEAMTGEPWPSKPERNARLKECADVVRALWAGETVSWQGRVRVKNAKLYSRPARPPLLVAAALTPETARWAGSWADAMITAASERETMRAVVDEFRAGGGAGKPLFLQVALAFGRTDDESARIAHDQWRQCTLAAGQLADLATPGEFDEATSHASVSDVVSKVRASADVERQLAWLQEDLALGFDRVYLHNLVRDHDRFFEACAERILPALDR